MYRSLYRFTFFVFLILSITNLFSQSLSLPCGTQDEDVQWRNLDYSFECDSPINEEVEFVDVLFVVTQRAEEFYQGRDQSSISEIETAIAEANEINRNSGVFLEFRRAHIELINYVEMSDLRTTVEQLIEIDDGVLDLVHDLRQEHQADLVTLIVWPEVRENCGFAATLTDPRNPDNYSFEAFSVIDAWCMRNNKSLLHEWGHNLGMKHDRIDYTSTRDPHCIPYWGLSRRDLGFTTIMGSNTLCEPSSCERIPYWSNSSIEIEWQNSLITIGHDSSNVAQGINQTKSVVADYSSFLDVNSSVKDSYIDIQIRPNPANETIFADDINEKVIDVSLFNLAGKRQKLTWDQTHSSVSISGMSALQGVHILHIHTKSEVYVSKVFLMRL